MITDEDKQRIEQASLLYSGNHNLSSHLFNGFIKGAEYATLYERQQQQSQAEYIKELESLRNELISNQLGHRLELKELDNEILKLEAERSELRNKVIEWISVKERLPEPDTSVLLAWLDCVEIGYLTIPEDKRFSPYWTDSGDEQPCYAKINESTVSHWMPLPKLP